MDLQNYQQDNQSFIIKVIANKFVQAGIAVIPYVGAPVQVIITETLQQLKQQRWEAYLASLESKVEALGRDKIDQDYLGTPDCIDRLQRIYEEVISHSDESKLSYLRDYFVACMWESAPDVTWKDLFLQYLSRLSGSHLGVLQTFYSLQAHLSYKDRFELPQRIPHRSPLTLGDICSQLENMDRRLVDILMADLAAMGLAQIWLGQPREPRGWSISDSGMAFMQFLSQSW